MFAQKERLSFPTPSSCWGPGPDHIAHILTTNASLDGRLGFQWEACVQGSAEPQRNSNNCMPSVSHPCSRAEDSYV